MLVFFTLFVACSLFTAQGDSSTQVRISSGTYTIGPPSLDDIPAHTLPRTVTLSYDYVISTTEVTIAEWLEITDSLPNQFCNDAPIQALTPQHPIRCVSWCEAVLFANLKSQKEGRTPAYDLRESADELKHPIKCNEHAQFIELRHDSNGWRLPTEAEWEIAGRLSENSSLTEQAWFIDNANGAHHPVAGKKNNPQGLFDMQGNLHEWIWERFGEFEATTVTDPISYDTPISDIHTRPIKGGAYDSKPKQLQPYNRPNASPSIQHPSIGFRLVYTAPNSLF